MNKHPARAPLQVPSIGVRRLIVLGCVVWLIAVNLAYYWVLGERYLQEALRLVAWLGGG